METLQDPGNLGSIIRTACAAGAEGLWLSADSCDLDNPKVLRASAGQWFRLPIAIVSLTELVRECQAAGIQVVATTPQAEVTYWELDFEAAESDYLLTCDDQLIRRYQGGLQVLNPVNFILAMTGEQ